MESVLLGLAMLACPIGMGVMMWMMGRGARGHAHETSAPQAGGVAGELTQLRAEVAAFRAQRANDAPQERR